IRLAVDVSSEPAGGMMLIGRGGAVGLENYLLFHAGLTIYDQDSNLTPRLAERLPTLENADWRLSPDGGMDVTWHLRPDAVWQDGRDGFLASPYWRREWVGLGPYRISNWTLGSQLEAAAFDHYVLGRPRIDRVVIQYFGDPNGAIAALMSGAVDMAPVGSTYVLDQMVTVKNAWDPAQAGTTMAIPRGVRTLKLQFRDPNAPWVRDVAVRRALAYATDRQAVVDTLEYGLTNVPDTWLPPEDPAYPLLQQSGLVQYRYDPAQAARLLVDAGWSRGADG